MKFFGTGDYITGIAQDAVTGWIVSMKRMNVVRYYWYKTLPQAKSAARYFKRKGTWPKHKQIRNELILPPNYGIIPTQEGR